MEIFSHKSFWSLAALLFATAMLGQRTFADDSADAIASREQLAFFEERVRPVLAEHCYACHGVESDRLQAGLLVDSREGLLTGGDTGPAIVPGDADASPLIEAIRYESYEMPPKGKLPDRDIAALEQWVAMGAPWPEEIGGAAAKPRETFNLEERRAAHWAWQSVATPSAPDVHDHQWSRNGADRFVLARLEEAGLEPADDVDRRGLLRRACFDLTGLPPTLLQIERFLQDERPDAFARVVDELLASRHFGERWGRHWLDLVRYAESRGHEFDSDAPNAYQYRDYVIRALNSDVPYDQFVTEHLAGDLMASPRQNPETGFNESVLGTGFWFLGEWVHSPVDIRRDEADRFDNMIDVMSKAFLGVTVSCARCHDHKFDAISTADYYALSGFLQSSDYRQVRFESVDHNREVATRLEEVDRTYRQRLADLLADAGLPHVRPEATDSARLRGIVSDYRFASSNEFLQDGCVFGLRPRLAGEALLVGSGEERTVQFAPRSAAVNDPAWHGLKSVTEGATQIRGDLANLPRSGRTLRTPTFELTEGILHCRVRGRGHVVACVDSHRLVDGPLHRGTVRDIEADSAWTRLDLTAYTGHRIHLEFTPAEGELLEVGVVLQGDSADDRRTVEQRERVETQLVDRYAAAAETLLGRDESVRSVYEATVREWSEAREAIEGDIRRESRLAMAMIDGTGENDHILIRGDSSKPGEPVPRRFLSAIAGDEPMAIDQGSGRLELAQSITDASNPLTDRVIVNRIWHHLMGRGIVPTTDDFGVLGERPTHPELLDHLASRFVHEGRSLKQTIRYVMLSRTYRLSSRASDAARAADPKNLLWSHRPPKRLQGEAIRDALLAVSGRFDEAMYGPSRPVHLTPFMTGRGRPEQSGALDGDGRRSIYVAVRRNFLSPFMLTFDMPAPFSTMGRRNVSNVPAQSLILMNDPLVAELSADWAARVLGTVPEDPLREPGFARVRSLYLLGYGREPTTAETRIALDFLSTQASARGVALSDGEVWADFAHALVNTKEFIFLR